MEAVKAIGAIFATIFSSIIRSLRRILDPSTPFYSFYLPNADTIMTLLPFLMFALLFLAALFASYLSYQRIFFLPENDKPLF